MPKISELNALTTVPGTDYVAVAHDVTGSPTTNKVLVSNFANSMTSYIGRANTTVFGTLKLGDGLAVNTSTGKVYTIASIPTEGRSEGKLLTYDANTGAPVWQYYAPVYQFTLVNDTNLYVVSEHESLIYVDCNAVSDNVTIVLPTPTAVQGKEYTIKNIDDAGGAFKVTVTTQDGIDFGSNYIENPVTGSFVQEYDLKGKGSGDTWVRDGTVWRHAATQRAVPIFYTSVDTYSQVVFKNASSANNASSDMVGYNNEGNEAEGTGPFVDMGINSNTYSDTTYGNVWGPSDAYLYNYGGNLIIGPQTYHSIKFIAGNTNLEDIKLEITPEVMYVNNNIISTKPYFDIFATSLAEISASTNGTGGGPEQAYIWAYRSEDYAEVGNYVQNNTSYASSYLYTNGTTQYSGSNSSISWNYIIRPINSDIIGIKPISGYLNELAIRPTGDYDIHLFEAGTGGAVTLGDYNATNFRVYGPGGANTGGQYGNDIRAELYGNSSFLISSNGYNWSFESDGSLTIPGAISLPTKSHTGWNWNYNLNGPTLQVSDDNTNEIIITGPAPDYYYRNSQRIVIQGQRGYGTWGQDFSGEGGDIYIWAGVGGESDLGGGSGGDIKIRGGQGQNNEGGYVKIEAGDADYFNSTSTGNGGFVEITAGDVIDSGGNENNQGGSITISAGKARHDSTKSGHITLKAGGSIDNSTQYETVFNNNGTITLSSNGDIKNTDGISVIKSIPQNYQASFSNYVLEITDAGKHIYKDDGDGYGVEVPTNASVPFEIGTVVTVVSGNGWTYIYPANAMDTELWGAGYNQTSTSFYIPNNSMATLLKIGTDKWMLSGAGLAID